MTTLSSNLITDAHQATIERLIQIMRWGTTEDALAAARIYVDLVTAASKATEIS